MEEQEWNIQGLHCGCETQGWNDVACFDPMKLEVRSNMAVGKFWRFRVPSKGPFFE